MKKLILTVDKKLNTVMLLAVVSVLSMDLYFGKLPALFPSADALFNTYYNLCIGIIVSYVFYIVVVHRKEVKDKGNIYTAIRPTISYMLTAYEFKLMDVCDGSHTYTFEGGFLSLYEAAQIFKNVNPNAGFNGKMILWNGAEQFYSRRTYLLSIGVYYKEMISTLHSKFGLLDSELVRLLTQIEECNFVRNAEHSSKFKYHSENMLSEVKSFARFSELCKELEEYHRRQLP